MIFIPLGILVVIFILLIFLPVSGSNESWNIKIIPRNAHFKEAVKAHEPFGIVVDSVAMEKKITNISKGNHKNYTCFGSNGVCKQYLHLLLAKNGYKFLSPKNFYGAKTTLKKLDYLRVELNPKTHEYDKESYGIKSCIKNVINDKTFRNLFSKEILGSTFANSGIVPEAFNLYNLPKKTVIVKPADKTGHSGFGIKIYTNPTKQEIEKDFLEHEKISISQYIPNPLLYQKRKFHFRVLMAVSNSWIKYAPIFIVVVAKHPYEADNYQDCKIHDTHAKSTPWYKTFPEGFEKSSREPILKGINLVMTSIGNKIKSVFSYPESDFSYQIAGVDIMFDENYKPWIIEVNNTSGFSLSFPEFKKFEKDFFTWEFYNCISQTSELNPWKNLQVLKNLELVFDFSSLDIHELHRVFGKTFNFRIHKRFWFIAKTRSDKDFAKFNLWEKRLNNHWLYDLSVD